MVILVPIDQLVPALELELRPGRQPWFLSASRYAVLCILYLWLPYPNSIIQSELINMLHKGIKMSSINSEEKPGNKIQLSAHFWPVRRIM